MRKRAYLYLVVFLALASFIIFTSTNSGASHNSLGGTIITWINNVFFSGSLTQAECSAVVTASAKLFGHFSLFLLDGLFFRLFLLETKLGKNKRTLLFLMVGLLLSIAGEAVQIFSANRYPSVFDVILDYSGFVLPFVFAYFLSWNKANQ
ncbi:MAG: VanZ family protein [Bacilli bacterium]|nr:VanZ family protein [Bacilli bacterium]